jgi:hypothetical protein
VVGQNKFHHGTATFLLRSKYSASPTNNPALSIIPSPKSEARSKLQPFPPSIGAAGFSYSATQLCSDHSLSGSSKKLNLVSFNKFVTFQFRPHHVAGRIF